MHKAEPWISIFGYCYEHPNVNFFFSIAIFVLLGYGALPFKIIFENTLSSIFTIEIHSKTSFYVMTFHFVSYNRRYWDRWFCHVHRRYTPHNFALGALQSSTRNLRFSSSAPLRKNDGKIPVNGDLEKSGTVKSAGRSSYEPMRTSRSSCMRPYLLLLTSRRTKHLPDVV